MAQDWFVIHNGKETGPYTAQQLKQLAANGKLTAADPVRRLDMQAAIPASKIKGLFAEQTAVTTAPVTPAIASTEVASAVPTAIPATTSASQQDGSAQSPSAFDKAKKTWQRLGTPAKIGIGAGGGCLMLLFMCCGGFGLLSMIGGSGSGGGGGGSKDTAMKVSASELFQDYKSNEVAADEKYKGKTLEVTGTVHSIGKDILNTIYVTLEGGGRFEIMSVQCYFSDKYKSEAARLSKGQMITVRGRCEGKFGNVQIKKCEFVK